MESFLALMLPNLKLRFHRRNIFEYETEIDRLNKKLISHGIYDSFSDFGYVPWAENPDEDIDKIFNLQDRLNK